MVEHVYRRASKARLVDRVLVATEDTRVRDRVRAFGGDCVMTSPRHPSGSDRIAEAVADLDVDLVVNVQGDEPLIEPRAIDQAVAAAGESGGRAIASLRKLITSAAELWDPGVVKVTTDRRGRALYFSRWPIPFAASADMSRLDCARRFDEAQAPAEGAWYKHIGLYVYPKPILLELTRREPSELERLEKLEQLRALELGIPIRLEVTDCDAISVDTPEDLEWVRKLVSAGGPTP
jgi:3-deoxy-manno-octulosonate cytidylyltransferase (CMP-KDO synthetase)